MDSDSLTIVKVTENDEGTYTCIMNTTLDQDSASAQLTVVGKDTLSSSLCRKVLLILCLFKKKRKKKAQDTAKRLFTISHLLEISLAKDHCYITWNQMRFIILKKYLKLVCVCILIANS